MGALIDTSKLPVFQTALQIRGTAGGTVAIPTGGAPANWSLTPNAIYYGFASILKAITVADGSVQAETQVASPAWDALAVANRRLYLTTQAGDVLCIGE